MLSAELQRCRGPTCGRRPLRACALPLFPSRHSSYLKHTTLLAASHPLPDSPLHTDAPRALPLVAHRVSSRAMDHALIQTRSSVGPMANSTVSRKAQRSAGFQISIE